MFLQLYSISDNRLELLRRSCPEKTMAEIQEDIAKLKSIMDDLLLILEAKRIVREEFPPEEVEEYLTLISKVKSIYPVI